MNGSNDIVNIERSIERYPWYSLAYVELFKKMAPMGDEHKNAALNKAAAKVFSRKKLFEFTIQKESTLNSIETSITQPISDKSEELEKVVDIETEKENICADDKEEISREEKEEIHATEKDNPQVEADTVVINATTIVPQEEEIQLIEQEEEDEISFVIDEEATQEEQKPKIIVVGGDYFGRDDFESIKLDDSKPLDKFIAERPSLVKQNPLPETKVSSEEFIEFDDTVFYTETLAKIYTEQGFYKRAIDVYAKLILLYPEKSSYFASLVQELKTKNNQ
jgi:tetratricopeptide (TPR) repeat protein